MRAFSTLLWSYFCFETILKAFISIAAFYTHTFAKFVLGKEQGTKVSTLRIICCNNSNVMEKLNQVIAFQMTATDPWQWRLDHNLTHKGVLLLGNIKLLNIHLFQWGCSWCSLFCISDLNSPNLLNCLLIKLVDYQMGWRDHYSLLM